MVKICLKDKKTTTKEKEPWEKDNDNPFTQKIPDNSFVIK